MKIMKGRLSLTISLALVIAGMFLAPTDMGFAQEPEPVMGDVPPHDPSREGLTAASVARAAEEADPVIIQAIVVGNEGVYSSEAVEAFRQPAELTGGNFFEADDASKVPEVLQETIKVIQPSGSSDLLSRASILLIGALCCLVVVVVGLIVFVVMFWGKKRRPAPRPVPPTSPLAPGRPPPSAPWQGETIVASPVVVANVTVKEGPDAGQHFSLKPNTRLGRAADNDIVLRDPQVSRYHATITFTGAEWTIVDPGSANGTTVNGVRIDQPRQLRHGDVIAIGSEQLVFQQR